jgi:hypothetical protein
MTDKALPQILDQNAASQQLSAKHTWLRSIVRVLSFPIRAYLTALTEWHEHPPSSDYLCWP